MKANELMVGDLVQVADTMYRLGFIAKVAEVYKEAIWTAPGEYEGECIEEWDIEPIPLTPEILEKNGFVKGWATTYELVQHTDDGRDLKFLVVYKLERKHLRIDSYTADTGIFSSFGISFVHQLQHALRLCGIEKEIVL